MARMNDYKVVTRDSGVLGVTRGESPPPVYGTSKPNDDPLSPENIVKFSASIFALSDEHRRPRKYIWDTCWDLYNNKHDFSQRAWWQNKAPIPKVRTSVDRAVGLFRKTLLRVNPFWGVQAESRLGKTKGNFSMLLVDYWYDQAQVLEALIDAFKVGLITSTAVLKVWFQTVNEYRPEVKVTSKKVPVEEFGVQTGETTQESRDVEFTQYQKGKFACAIVDPYNFWVIPKTRGTGAIERAPTTLAEIQSLVKQKVYGGLKDKTDKELIDELRNLNSCKEEDSNAARRANEGIPNANQYIRELELYHYWCDIYDTDGNLVMCDARYTLANNSILLSPPRKNPFYHKMPPYIIGTPYKIPFSTYNRGMVEDVAEIAKNITELSNLIADGALYDALKAFAIDSSTLDDPNEAKQGIYPGKAFVRNGNGALPGQKTVETVDVGHIPQEAMSMLALWEKYFQEGSYVNEWVSGQSGRGAGTLGEAQLKSSSALEGLDESARNLELTLVEPLLDMSAKVIYQYHDDYRLERLMENYPNVALLLQDMSPAERYATMVGGYTYKARGLSIMIDRQAQMEEVKEILTLLSYMPGLLDQLNGGYLIEKIFEPLSWDLGRLLQQPGQNSTTSPSAGAAPRPNSGPSAAPMVPPGGGGSTPMQQRNAAEGTRMGGNRNNPGQASQSGGGAPGMQLPPKIVAFLEAKQRMTSGRY